MVYVVAGKGSASAAPARLIVEPGHLRLVLGLLQALQELHALGGGRLYRLRVRTR
jgi:hypothetical protein